MLHPFYPTSSFIDHACRTATGNMVMYTCTALIQHRIPRMQVQPASQDGMIVEGRHLVLVSKVIISSPSAACPMFGPGSEPKKCFCVTHYPLEFYFPQSKSVVSKQTAKLR
jgi:hypothetical protein